MVVGTPKRTVLTGKSLNKTKALNIKNCVTNILNILSMTYILE